ncbi:hypothetical protein CR513_44346, partial [Mucuna pruriens]
MENKWKLITLSIDDLEDLVQIVSSTLAQFYTSSRLKVNLEKSIFVSSQSINVDVIVTSDISYEMVSMDLGNIDQVSGLTRILGIRNAHSIRLFLGFQIFMERMKKVDFIQVVDKV